MLAAVSDDRILMPINTDDLATLSQADLVRLRIENRAWSNELRRRMAALVNSRMAKKISHEEYSTSRKTAKDEMAECNRKMAMLGR